MDGSAIGKLVTKNGKYEMRLVDDNQVMVSNVDTKRFVLIRRGELRKALDVLSASAEGRQESVAAS